MELCGCVFAKNGPLSFYVPLSVLEKKNKRALSCSQSQRALPGSAEDRQSENEELQLCYQYEKGPQIPRWCPETVLCGVELTIVKCRPFCVRAAQLHQ